MASKKKITLSKHSRLNIQQFPAKVEQIKNQFLIYCHNGPARAYLHDWYGSILTFKSSEEAHSFIDSYK